MQALHEKKGRKKEEEEEERFDIAREKHKKEKFVAELQQKRDRLRERGGRRGGGVEEHIFIWIKSPVSGWAE